MKYLLSSVVLASSLLGCGHAARPPASPATSPDNVAAADAVQVHLYARDDERWTLRRGDDSYVCTLPCSYWVRPASGLVIRLEGTTPTVIGAVPESDASFDVPSVLPANPHERITLTVDRTHGLGTLGKIIAAPLAVTFGLMGLAFTTIGTASLATGSKNTTTSASGCTTVKDPNGNAAASGCATTTTHGAAADVAAIGIGVGALTVAVLSTIWFFHDRQGGLRYEGAVVPASASAPSASTPSALRVRLTPDGVSGTF
jgi:hypothetical protein